MRERRLARMGPKVHAAWDALHQAEQEEAETPRNTLPAPHSQPRGG